MLECEYLPNHVFRIYAHRGYSLYELIDEVWEIAGAVAAVAQTITTIFGIKQIRHRYYEIFYSSHVALIL